MYSPVPQNNDCGPVTPLQVFALMGKKRRNLSGTMRIK
jgi:hypothetical protein